MSEEGTTINEVVTELYPRIQRAAGRVYAEQIVPMVEKDDIAQQMALRALERAHQIPGFADQKPAYIMTDVVQNAGKRTCEKERTYTHYVGADNVVFSDDEGFETTITEIVFDSAISPEDELIEKEYLASLTERIRKLTPECQQVIALAMKGLTDADIARELKVTRSAIAHRRETINKHLKV